MPIDQVHTVLLDQAHGHLFMSTGEGRDEILVTDLSGAVVRRFTGLAEPAGLVLDGTTLHVALRGSAAVLAIDTATLTVLGPRPLPADVCPDELAMTAGRLVFTATNCGDTFTDGWLGTLDPADGSVTLHRTQDRRAVLAANAASDGLVAVADTYSSPSTLVLYDVRGAEPTFLRAQAGPAGISDVAMAPSGDSVFVSLPVKGGYAVPLETLAFGRP